jgi:type IV pilus assembly protein PilV
MMPPGKIRQSGTFIIESLIAVVILSVGLLGIGLLQLQSKHLNLQSIQRSEASMLASEIVERMRNNRASLESYFTTVGGGSITAVPDPNCTQGTTCTPAELVGHDLWQWEQAIDGAAEIRSGNKTGGLHMATGCISGPAKGVSGLYNVTIVWRGRNTSDNISTNTCGVDTGKYDNASGDNAYRRLLSLDVYVTS